MKSGQFVLILLVICELHVLHSMNDSFILCLFQKENLCQECSENFTDFNSSVILPPGNFTIQFCSEQFILTSEFRIDNKSAVNITGFPTKLNCTQSNPVSFQFSGVTDLFLYGIELYSCGGRTIAPSSLTNSQLITSIYIVSCTNIQIKDLYVSNSLGNGLTMINNDGTIIIENSKFIGSKNTNPDLAPGGSGLYIIVLSYCTPMHVDFFYNCQSDFGKFITKSHYIISKSNFTKNVASGSNFTSRHEFLAGGHGKGGGLSIVIAKDSSANMIEIMDCKFNENSATKGGGLYIVVLDTAHGNKIRVTSCIFDKNSCSNQAGGAVNVGYENYGENSPQNNSMNLRSCIFRENSALFGGGVRFHASQTNFGSPNKVLFQNCTWIENKASIGAALDIGTSMWERFHFDVETEIMIDSCTFTSNLITYDRNYNKSSIIGGGTVLAVGYRIQFKGKVTFNNNSGSAVYAISAEVVFISGSNVTFTNNIGQKCGAIHLQTFSALILNDNVLLNFINNHGMSLGGAIYHDSSDIRDFFASNLCFIVYNGTRNISERNVSLIFKNNTVGRDYCYSKNCNNSIYTSTMIPCLNDRDSSTPQDAFSHIGEFVIPYHNYEISTFGATTNLLEKRNVVINSTVVAVPGIQICLPLLTLNDFQKEVKAFYHVLVKKPSTSVSVADYYVDANNSIILLGKPGDSGTLVLESTNIRHSIFEFRVFIQECPPGFRYNSTANRCHCFKFNNKRYSGLQSCDSSYTDFGASINQDYWMNYAESDGVFGKERNLLLSSCPLSHCTNGSAPKKLPNTTNITELDLVICGETRTSILCSQCRKNYTTKYHDNEYTCQLHNTYECQVGWLYYIISEIFPVTLFFAAVTVFKIKLTDGAVSGFLLYVQLTDVMRIEANGLLSFSKHLKVALDIYRFTTRIFNLNFFAINSLSFCLWKNATTMDMAAFKYVTLLYSLVLVLGIVAAFRYCRRSKLVTALSKLGYRNEPTKGVIIHGISGFLMACYSEFARISLLLLAPSHLRRYSHENSRYYIYKTVAFYDGSLNYFSGKHLLYALPALFATIFVGIIPPFLLISYPLCYKVLGIFKVSESRFSKLLCTVFPLEKFKPFFDSFQTSYKDEYRFFSGLYFLYRFSTLAIFAFSRWTNFYTLLQIQLSIFLAAHALCKPYKKSWHNVLNTLLLLNLTLLNALTYFNFNTVTTSVNDIDNLFVTTLLQTILLYSVLIYFIIYVVKQVFSNFIKTQNSLVLLKLKLKKKDKSEPDDYHELSHNFSLNAAENRLKQ